MHTHTVIEKYVGKTIKIKKKSNKSSTQNWQQQQLQLQQNAQLNIKQQQHSNNNVHFRCAAFPPIKQFQLFYFCFLLL